ncbi:hypothetical protein JOD29_003382 [Lysinibacillus composti]|uniref:Spore cortex biosynthesis protein YabQ n=1 Tax=Lysinibacillus composti TaxID=720633 RepID=A0A3N9U9I1_9BACI|nr:spore cortex biosynthesis protein YabQ [Lysinibacillus composti]MBM7610104.1 hypothetical protein [Lysinibacillus composti]RQW73248.1 hypothetical protein EBB45_17490 [Lysinibacillus composti]
MTVSEQLVSIIIMIASGIVVGAVIDCIRSMLLLMSPKSLLRKITYGIELSVWALLGAITFYILFTVKGGEWRLVDPLAQISGIFLYEAVFQRFFRFLGRLFVILIINPIVFIINLILTIIKTTFKLLIRIILILLTPFIKLYKRFLPKIHRKFRTSIFKKR